jgi:hypothetical protein
VSPSPRWQGYALFTHQGLERAQADKSAFVQQTENYEHLGAVETYIMDMHIRYDEMKSA